MNVMKNFDKNCVPKCASDNCNVYIATSKGAFPICVNGDVLKLKDIDKVKEPFNIMLGNYKPIMTTDGKFEEEKVVIFSNRNVRYFPQRKPSKDELTEMIMVERCFRW